MSKNNYIIEKSNILNTLRCNDMGFIEFRLFCLYLSKLNARNPQKRTVQISISEFEKLFDIKFNTTVFNKKIKQIAGRTIEIKNDTETKILTLYSEFRWSNVDVKMLNITCNYDIVPYIFELKKNYTTYVLSNISKLNSVAKIRLYEICKQYEKINKVELSLDELQKMIGSKVENFKYLKRDVIEPAVTDINKYTDITISYEKILKNRKVVALKFKINGKVKEIAVSEPTEKEIPKIPQNTNDCFAELYNRYFKNRNINQNDAKTIIKKLNEKINSSSDEELENYINNLMTAYDKQRESKILVSKTGYIIGMIENNAFLQEPEYEEREEQSYDINEFEKYAVNYELFKNVKDK